MPRCPGGGRIARPAGAFDAVEPSCIGGRATAAVDLDPGLDAAGTPADPHVAAGTQTLSGSFTMTATNTGIGPQSDSISLLAALWVDSAAATPPVPEPGGLARAAAGLSTVLAALRRRGRRAAQLAA